MGRSSTGTVEEADGAVEPLRYARAPSREPATAAKRYKKRSVGNVGPEGVLLHRIIGQQLTTAKS